MGAVCGFNPAVDGFREALAFESAGALSIGRIDDIQKLHTRNIPLNDEQPRRITHQPSSATYLVLTIKHSVDETDGQSHRPHPALQRFCWFVSHH